MSKIRKGDQVVVLTGRDKGKRGTVLKVLPDFSRAVVEGVNRVKKHTKPNPMKNTTGGIVEKEMSMDLSNIAIFNPATSKADRVGYKTLEDKRKVRVFRSNGEVIDA
ncbi:MAG: 50S ribosomal protein L24 [Burkholderiales bacterium]|nr:50S ribosomal protein L24 [Burkholderiales bacterium]